MTATCFTVVFTVVFLDGTLTDFFISVFAATDFETVFLTAGADAAALLTLGALISFAPVFLPATLTVTAAFAFATALTGATTFGALAATGLLMALDGAFGLVVFVLATTALLTVFAAVLTPAFLDAFAVVFLTVVGIRVFEGFFIALAIESNHPELRKSPADIFCKKDILLHQTDDLYAEQTIFASDFPSLSASVLGYSEEHYAHLNNTFCDNQMILRKMKQPKTLNRKPLIIPRERHIL
ncbi:hypothetical protein [Undibacterium sp. CY21W]|uniref:hypothetical protein n=1 Tax=Undibacterium sp. CY21W TaxID=2762293 RepID=UPI00164B6371|nr:hypothetical protein [Undibacterium sp. CY21W]MBC3929029.1 hypothetical protein [Undibacterium sp. CY21W]